MSNRCALLLIAATLASRAETVSNLPVRAAANAPLTERFAHPPAAARILRIVHAQPDDPAEQDRRLRKLQEQGFGGFVGNVSFDGYVDDESKWPAFLRGMRAAKAAGLSLWLYDEYGYPSGSARDLTLRGHPDWAARGLLVAETNSTGGDVTLTLPPGTLVSAVAVPVRDGVADLERATNLAASVRDGRLQWAAPAGDWRVFAMTDDLIYDGTHAAVSLAYKKPCIDLLRPETTARFLEVTHDRYAEKLGPDLGKYFVSTFTDEPSLMNYWFRPMPWRVLPWSPGLAQEFKRRRNADLHPLLPALVTEAGPRGAKARFDFWQTISELVSANYFGQIQTWCRNHDVLSGGHLLMEEGLAGHVPLYGDFFRCARRLDAPSIDCLTSIPRDVPWRIARTIDSIAALEGRSVTMCEVSDHVQRHRPAGDTRPVRVVSEDEIRGTCNRLLGGGIGTLTSYYSFDKLDDTQLRRLNEWVGRCSTTLAGGHQVADIAVLYPVESVWAKFVPARHGATDAAGARRIERIYEAATEALFAAGRDFSYVDSRAIAEARVKGDALVHGDLRWRVLVLPAADTLPGEAWERAESFWRKGGIVIAIGARPANSERAFPSPAVQSMARELFGDGSAPFSVTNRAGGTGIFLPAGMVSLLPALLDDLIERDADSAVRATAIHTTHRRVDGHDVYFAINDSAQAWSGSLRFPGEGVSEQWNPDTGERSVPTCATNVPLQLGPYGAMLFRARSIAAPKRLSGAGHEPPRFVESTLTVSAPHSGHGEFVRATLTGDAATGWTADANLTRSAVDTHLFLSFELSATGALREAHGLVFDTVVPNGQRTPAELLAIVHTRDGGDYLAFTGSFLGETGAQRAYVAFGQFATAGWSKTEKPLDPAEITAIRIGWGGYFGTEGERIVFTAKPPQAFR